MQDVNIDIRLQPPSNLTFILKQAKKMRFLRLIAWLANFGTSFANCAITPIEIEGRHFVNSVSRERFYIRGVDYQPGGAAAYDHSSDPLSDPNTCARDILLFQSLGINTVRVYTVNPDLDHSKCMTMLAVANIYLVLDINSPFYSESLNRYEPWTTYTRGYLNHIFKVVHQFSRYNNTLAFFIGNEIVNDEKSASTSPAYIRAVTRDVKDYLYFHCPRDVPVGYSAADDLKYRVELPHYLTCGDSNSTVDFYGVNSYQWCGSQTYKSSGYDKLVDDHRNITVPVFLSEYGCNLVQPRLFQEVNALYSAKMTSTFDGGLVYEYSQEDNNYGLVDIRPNGDAMLRTDFFTLRKQFMDSLQVSDAFNRSVDSIGTTPNIDLHDQGLTCMSAYPMLPGSKMPIPRCPAPDLILSGVEIKAESHYVRSILKSPIKSNFSIYDSNEVELPSISLHVINNLTTNPIDYVWMPIGSRPLRALKHPPTVSLYEQASKSQVELKSRISATWSDREQLLNTVRSSSDSLSQTIAGGLKTSGLQLDKFKEDSCTIAALQKATSKQNKSERAENNAAQSHSQDLKRKLTFWVWCLLENLHIL